MNVNPCVPKKEKGSESLGDVCISTLNWWQPHYKIKDVILNIYSLFYMHNEDNAYGIEIIQEYNKDNDHSIYFEKAKYFTKKYANPNNNKFDRSKDWDFNL